MRKSKYNLLLDQSRYDLIVLSLIEMKNHLILAGGHTDVVDEALLKVLTAKRKNYYVQEIKDGIL